MIKLVYFVFVEITVHQRLLTLKTSSGSVIDPNNVVKDIKDIQYPLQKVTTDYKPI
jgi:hypothetical protein